jgi:hypothetical protein
MPLQSRRMSFAVAENLSRSQLPEVFSRALTHGGFMMDR